MKRAVTFVTCALASLVTASAQSADLDTTLERTETVLAHALGDVAEDASPLLEMFLLPPDYVFPDDLRYSGEKGPDRPIEDANRELVRNVGLTSGLLAGCGLDWINTQFAPMMAWQRERLPENERNGLHIAKIGVSHGFAMEAGTMLSSNSAFDCAAMASRVEGVTFGDDLSNP